MNTNLVKFITLNQSQFDYFKSNNELLDNALYFISDTKKIFKGSTQYGVADTDLDNIKYRLNSNPLQLISNYAGTVGYYVNNFEISRIVIPPGINNLIIYMPERPNSEEDIIRSFGLRIEVQSEIPPKVTYIQTDPNDNDAIYESNDPTWETLKHGVNLIYFTETYRK